MDIEKLTERARGFLQAAQTIAIREFHQRIAPEHLLKALLDDGEGAAAGLIRAAGGDPAAAKTAVDAEVARFPTVRQPNTVAVDPSSGRVFVGSRETGQLQLIDARG